MNIDADAYEGLQTNKISAIQNGQLDLRNYTVSVLNYYYRLGRFSQSRLLALQREIASKTKELIIKYNNGRTSSIKIGHAKEIMDALMYVLDAYLLSFEDADRAAEALQTTSVDELHAQGIILIKSLIDEAKASYEAVMLSRVPFPTIAYNDTIEGIQGFFDAYDIDFGAHETPVQGMIDYPVALDDKAQRGILYIKQYLEKLCIENKGCNSFPKQNVAQILANYQTSYRIKYKELWINLFESIVNNAIFSVLAGNYPLDLTLTEPQINMIQQNLCFYGDEELDRIILNAVDQIAQFASINDADVYQYMKSYVVKLLPAIKTILKDNRLSSLVLVNKPDEKILRQNEILLKSERLSDEAFRKLVKQILACRDTNEKIALIQSAIQHFDDFLDVLRADCLFGDEYRQLYEQLEPAEITMLALKRFSTFEGGLDQDPNFEGDWEKELYAVIQASIYNNA